MIEVKENKEFKDHKVINGENMKQGWEIKKLGEVGTVITGSTPSTKDEDNYSSKDYCFVKPSDISNESISLIQETEAYISEKAYSKCRKLPQGSVLTTCIGIIGKVGILKVDATCNQQINGIIPNKDIIISEFLAYSLISCKKYLQGIANAPVVPIINKKEFSEVSIPVPPLAEQEKIVAELDCLSGVIEKKKQQLKELDALAESIFYTMFGDPITNEKGWGVKKFEECYKLASGNGLSAKQIIDGEYPVYGGNGIVGYHHEYNLDGNNIIIGRVGALCGNVRNVEGEAFITDNAFILTKKIDNDNVFLLHLLRIHNLRKYAREAMQPVISNAGLKNIDIIITPIALQQEFADKIEAIEEQKELIKQSITETEELFNSRMDYYFN